MQAWAPQLFALGWVAITMCCGRLATSFASPSLQAQLSAYGEYRKVHSRIQEYCESIVFFGGTKCEFTRASHKLDIATDARMKSVLSTSVSLVVNLTLSYSTSIVCFVALLVQHFYISPFKPDKVMSLIQVFSGLYVFAWVQLPIQLQGIGYLQGYLKRINDVKLNRL